MKINERFELKNLGDSVVLIEKAMPKRLIKLNRTAAEILSAITDGADKNEVAAMMSEKYDIEVEKSKQDVESAIEKFVEAEIIEA